MAPPKKIVGQTSIITVRADSEDVRIAAGIAALRKETISEVLRNSLQDYIKMYRSDAMKVLNNDAAPHEPNAEADDWVDPIETGKLNAETLAALKDVKEGRVERFESKEALYKDLGLI